MSAFTDFYKKRLFKQGDGQRLTTIDFLINEVVAEMQSVVDPTRWNVLLDQKEALELEREGIVARSGEFKMQ